MKLEMREKKGHTVSFVLQDIDAATANTLRRLVIEEVPVVAINTVNFIKNDSALYDEIVAHRLGLIPLKADTDMYNLPGECTVCKGKGCSRCQITLTLDVEGPCTVYAKDIKSRGSKVQVVYPDMPIVKLLKGQKLEAELIATLGKGREHTKFSPALVYYQAYPEIKIKDNKKAIPGVAVCPTHVFSLHDDKVKIEALEKCILCNACVEATAGAIEVKGSKTDFIFHIESWGQLTPKEILTTALDIFDKKLNEFVKLATKLK